MSNAFAGIKRSLQEAIPFPEGRAPGARIHRSHPAGVEPLRGMVGMTQE